MSVGNIIAEAVKIIPVAYEWIKARLEGGEDPEEIRRDIMDRRNQVIENRKKRDAEFKEKFKEEI